MWDGNRIYGIKSGSNKLQAQVVINAAGAWAGLLDPNLTLPIYPLHGQIMSLSGPPNGLQHNLSRTGRWGYATPREDGRIIIGATEDNWGYQKKITPDGMTLLSTITKNLLPNLSEYPILDVWSGLRPATPDGLPVIEPDHRTSEGYL